MTNQHYIGTHRLLRWAFKTPECWLWGFMMDASIQREQKVEAAGHLQLSKDGISREPAEFAAENHDGHDREEDGGRLLS